MLVLTDWSADSGALSRHEMIGVFLFQEKVVNSTKYLGMLDLFAVPRTTRFQPNLFFQQDGAPLP
jgi:hypothetical protein